MCPSSGPFYIVSHYIKWAKTSWTYSMFNIVLKQITGRPVYRVQPLYCVQYENWKQYYCKICTLWPVLLSNIKDIGGIHRNSFFKNK